MTEENLIKSIEEALVLVRYASREGISINTKVISAVVGAKEGLTAGNWSAVAETEFWSAYATLAKAVQPTTVVSLVTMESEVLTRPGWRFWGPKQNIPTPNILKRKFQSWALVSLAILLIVQVYWVFGNTVVNRLDKIEIELNTIQLRLVEIAKIDPNKVAEVDRKKIIKDRERLITDEQIKTARFNAQIDILKFLTFSLIKAQSGASVQEVLKKSQISRVTLEFVLNVLSTYLLPLLYGWLGAAAYILRDFTVAMRRSSVYPDVEIRYSLRMYLGAVAGLSIGWFYGFESKSLVNALSPLALAFIAGYSVELLFSAMDTFIDAFTKKNHTTRPTPPKGKGT
ncbi:MAG: hypothetical protein O7I42_22050 [Alphaproteobacteria bacterium]|nr:hypothetical protein [Alphaproteobacteria bacterium]